MTYFPFDNQVCALTFGSWAYDEGSIDLFPRNSKGDLSYLARNGEFIIKGDINFYFRIVFISNNVRRLYLYLCNVTYFKQVPIIFVLQKIFKFFTNFISNIKKTVKEQISGYRLVWVIFYKNQTTVYFLLTHKIRSINFWR